MLKLQVPYCWHGDFPGKNFHFDILQMSCYRTQSPYAFWIQGTPWMKSYCLLSFSWKDFFPFSSLWGPWHTLNSCLAKWSSPMGLQKEERWVVYLKKYLDRRGSLISGVSVPAGLSVSQGHMQNLFLACPRRLKARANFPGKWGLRVTPSIFLVKGDLRFLARKSQWFPQPFECGTVGSLAGKQNLIFLERPNFPAWMAFFAPILLPSVGGKLQFCLRTIHRYVLLGSSWDQTLRFSVQQSHIRICRFLGKKNQNNPAWMSFFFAFSVL